MTDPDAASPQLASEPAPGGLRRDSLNLPRLAFIGLAYFSLAPVIYLNMGFMESDSGGPVMPLLFILITIAVLPDGDQLRITEQPPAVRGQRIHLAVGVDLSLGRPVARLDHDHDLRRRLGCCTRRPSRPSSTRCWPIST